MPNTPTIQAAWQLINAAPVECTTALLVLIGAIWGVINFIYRTRFANKQAEIDSFKRQLDEYKDKLNGASPKEARERIESLERKLEERLGPRYPLTEDQEYRLKSILNTISSGEKFKLEIRSPTGYIEHAYKISKVFQNQGWDVTVGARIDLNQESSGIGVAVSNIVVEHENLYPKDARTLIRIFKDANIPYTIGSFDMKKEFFMLIVARPPE